MISSSSIGFYSLELAATEPLFKRDWSMDMILERASLMLDSWTLSSFSSLIFLNMQLKRFLTLFSVRPGSCLTISDQRFPIFLRSCKICRSSSVVNGSLLISGLRKLYHLSLHCFPFLMTLLLLLFRPSLA